MSVRDNRVLEMTCVPDDQHAGAVARCDHGLAGAALPLANQRKQLDGLGEGKGTGLGGGLLALGPGGCSGAGGVLCCSGVGGKGGGAAGGGAVHGVLLLFTPVLLRLMRVRERER